MISRSRWVVLSLVCALATATVTAPRNAHAMSPDVKAVLVAGTYGMAGGTLLGLASVPFSGDYRTVFMGSSLGLYLGIAVGFYYVAYRDDPENPLRPRRGYPEDTWSRRDVQDTERDLRSLAARGPELTGVAPDRPLEMRLPVLRF